jgi:hypothetical protein
VIRASFPVELIEERDATVTLRLLTGFGDPLVIVAKENVEMREVEAMATCGGSDPT